jgi:hypothetical protein
MTNKEKNYNNLPNNGTLPIQTISALITRKLNELGIKLRPTTKVKLLKVIEIMGDQDIKEPLKKTDIISLAKRGSFYFGEDTHKEIHNLLKKLLLAEVVKKIDTDIRPTYWLLYKIEKNPETGFLKQDKNKLFLGLWIKCCNLRIMILECQIPESALGMIEILLKLKSFAGHLQNNNTLNMEKHDLTNFYDILNNVIFYSEKFERIYYEFKEMGEFLNDEDLIFQKLKKEMTDLHKLIIVQEYRNGENI